jgi:hypothetical protein
VTAGTAGAVSGLVFALTSGNYYSFRFGVVFRSSAGAIGLRVGLTFPAATIVTATARIPIAADGAGGEFQGWITSSGDMVIGTGVQTANVNYFAEIAGMIAPTANGNLQVIYGSEVATAALGPRILSGSFGTLSTV